MDPRNPDAKYSSYEDMHNAEKDLMPITFGNGIGDKSRCIEVTEELSSDYDFTKEFDEQVVPSLTQVRDILTKNNVPFVFIAAPATNADGRVTNCCIGYLPGKRTPGMYRFVADVVKNDEDAISKISNKALVAGKAMGIVELEDMLDNMEEAKFDKKSVMALIRARATSLMMESILKSGNSDLKDRLGDLLGELAESVRDTKDSEEASGEESK